MYAIKCVVEFAYGHRLLDYEGPCKYLHGHNGKAVFELAADELDQRGMVADFSEVKRRLNSWIKENLDHRMVLSRDDPLLETLTEMNEPVYVIDENPTAENIARLLYRVAKEQGLPVVSVEFWETSTNCARYAPEQ